jgi:hypothetical protein
MTKGFITGRWHWASVEMKWDLRGRCVLDLNFSLTPTAILEANQSNELTDTQERAVSCKQPRYKEINSKTVPCNIEIRQLHQTKV